MSSLFFTVMTVNDVFSTGNFNKLIKFIKHDTSNKSVYKKTRQNYFTVCKIITFYV